MSIRCVAWALNEAPVEEPVQVLVLVAMAEKANDDGTSAYQSKATIAGKARISVRTAQRVMTQLEELGVIKRGNQDAAAHLPGNRRPVVYDLQVHLRRGDNLTPQTQVTPLEEPSDLSPESPQDEVRGDKSELRGDTGGQSGVTRMADKSSYNSSLITRPSSVSHQRKRWAPSEQAVQTAKTEVIKHLQADDLPLITIRYEAWCHERRRAMTSGEWLQWVIRDEKEARAKALEEKKAKQKNTVWHYVDS